MKKQREGTLERLTFARRDGDDLRAAAAELRKYGVLGLDDFLSKAEGFANGMLASGAPMRADAGRRLAGFVDDLRRAIAKGADVDALYAAVCAGITWSTLRAELRDDRPKRKGQRLTRTRYFAAKAKYPKLSLEKLADVLDVTKQALVKFKRDHTEND